VLRHDPLVRAARYMVAAGIATPEELLGHDQDARAEIAAAASFAVESPMPSPDTVRDHVFA
jgi:TPP-dependent pyruvate/acetoin dehydrogenase alpha subunit